MAASWDWEDVWALCLYGSQYTRDTLYPQLIEIMQKLPRTDLKKALKDAPEEIANQFIVVESKPSSSRGQKSLVKEIIRLSCGGH